MYNIICKYYYLLIGLLIINFIFADPVSGDSLGKISYKIISLRFNFISIIRLGI